MVVIIQVYEWTTMITIIKWQKNKSLGQIIHQITEEGGDQKFMRQEKINYRVFSLFILVTFLVNVFYVFEYIDITSDKIKQQRQNFKMLHHLFGNYDLLVMTVLTFVFVPVVLLLSNYHRNTYEFVKVNLWTFYFVEMCFIGAYFLYFNNIISTL